MKSGKYFVILMMFLFMGNVLAYAPRVMSQREMMYRMFAPFDDVNNVAKVPENSTEQTKTTEVLKSTSQTKVLEATKPNKTNNKIAPSYQAKIKIKKNSDKKTKKNQSSLQTTTQQVYSLMETVTPTKSSALEERLESENLVSKTPFGISFFKPTYILPAYYTSSPYGTVYRGTTPDNQQIMPMEFKGQLSVKFPLVKNLIGKYSSLNLSYTQLSYWQFYAKSQYFRETDYEPALFWTDRIVRNWWFNLGVMHESNGRGGSLERSWNRVFGDLMISGSHWLVDFNPWLLIFQNDSSNLHNPHIVDYMGHGQTTIAYKIHQNEFSLMLRNNIESRFRHGAVEFTYNFPIYGHLSGYTQFFAGYGQSLIEYNHSTKAVGIGIALSNWI